jgi:hypothetical protein
MSGVAATFMRKAQEYEMANRKKTVTSVTTCAPVTGGAPTVPLPVSNVHVFSQDVLQAAVTVRVSDVREQLNNLSRRLGAALSEEQARYAELDAALVKAASAMAVGVDTSKERDLIERLSEAGYNFRAADGSASAVVVKFVGIVNEMTGVHISVHLTLKLKTASGNYADTATGVRDIILPFSAEMLSMKEKMLPLSASIEKKKNALAETVKNLGSLRTFEERLRAEASRMALSQTAEGVTLLERLEQLKHCDTHQLAADAGLLA